MDENEKNNEVENKKSDTIFKRFWFWIIIALSIIVIYFIINNNSIIA